MGENGAAIQFGVELPPKQYYILPYSENAIEELRLMKEDILGLCSNNVWLQPNLVGLTVFPQNKEQFKIIRDYLNDNEAARRNTSVYEHIDSFDITPKGINKAEGMKCLCQMLGILPEETVAVGDGENDVPMFEIAGYSIGIATKERIKTDIRFDTISEALNQLIKMH
jgi:hydroxymethylpyrimidine pyrophosphatase-like HAD family hydrolase